MTARHTHLAPVGSTPVQNRGARSPLSIIRSAIAQRKHLVAHRIGQLTSADIARPVRELEVWLAQNPTPSHATIAAFWAGTLGRHLRTLMPSTVGGGLLLEEFERFTQPQA